jgi:hypothetical protein
MLAVADCTVVATPFFLEKKLITMKRLEDKKRSQFVRSRVGPWLTRMR